MKKEPMILIADTESNVPKREAEDIKDFKTEVWACGVCEIGGKNMMVFENDGVVSPLEKMFDYIAERYGSYDINLYFHNLAWDGFLILDWLMREKDYSQGKLWRTINEIKAFEANRAEILKRYPERANVIKDPPKGRKKRLTNKQFDTVISDAGLWYKFTFVWNNCAINCVDSLKILPFKVEQLAKYFETNHQKLVGEIDYTIPRYGKYAITPEERAYIENDIYVVAEALEKVEPYGLLDHLTIGSTALFNFKKMLGDKYDIIFPDIGLELDNELRKSYRGGWCYVNNKKADKDGIIEHNGSGYVYDVNSLYPYVLHSKHYDYDTKHIYPVGLPIATGEDADELFNRYGEKCWFIKVRCEFVLKENHLPFIQIKKSRFKDNEYIERSDGPVTITLTKPDFELFEEHYDIYDMCVLKWWAFEGQEGVFDSYIDYWYAKKEEATKTGNKVERQISKLMQNSLYGKLATRLDASSYIPYFEDGKVKMVLSSDSKDRGVYLPAGAYCTAYARGVTVRAAQRNFKSFMYSDTDSIHLSNPAIGIEIDPTSLGAWANEAEFTEAKYVRQKTYIEKISVKDGKPVAPYWDVKAAGCPDSVKERLLYVVDINEDLKRINDKTSPDYGKVLNEKRSDDEFVNRFTFGLKESGKLARARVEGGCILYNSTFEIKKM